MSDSAESSWVFDSLVGFLQGPIWSAPLLTFIEERSLNTDDIEEYREAYQEYKNLVDLLLGCYMEDMGITPEQFEHACAVNRNTKMPIPFQQSLFEQIWAANEYQIFRRMMIQKNLELQLQALNMIEQKFGLTPAALTCGVDLLNDELVMEELIHQKIQEDNDESVENSSANLEEEHERLANQYQVERAALEEALRVSVESSSPAEPEERTWPVNESNLQPEEFEALPKMKKSTPLGPITKAAEEEPLKKQVELKQQPDEDNQEDIKKREDYLKGRRDKLVALKKEARSQRLQMTRDRPGSARIVAEAAMNGKQDLETSQSTDSSLLQVRKALAARLKAEVVGQ